MIHAGVLPQCGSTPAWIMYFRMKICSHPLKFYADLHTQLSYTHRRSLEKLHIWIFSIHHFFNIPRISTTTLLQPGRHISPFCHDLHLSLNLSLKSTTFRSGYVHRTTKKFSVFFPCPPPNRETAGAVRVSQYQSTVPSHSINRHSRRDISITIGRTMLRRISSIMLRRIALLVVLWLRIIRPAYSYHLRIQSDVVLALPRRYSPAARARDACIKESLSPQR